MESRRKFPRYLISTNGSLSARLHSIEVPLKLFTFGQGGCSFLGLDPELNLVPPQTVRFTVEYGEHSASSLRKEIDGSLIYVRPHNPTMKMMFGFRFEPNQVNEMLPFVTELEDLNKRGLVDRA